MSPNLRASFWMSGTLASLIIMALGSRELSGDMSTLENFFFRSLIGLASGSRMIFTSDLMWTLPRPFNLGLQFHRDGCFERFGQVILSRELCTGL